MPWLSNHGRFVFIYVHIYHIPYIYIIYISYSYHFISYIIYTSYPSYIFFGILSKFKKKTSNLNFQHVQLITLAQAEQLLSESLLCPTSGFPPREDGKNTRLFPRKNLWKPEVYQENSTKSSQFRNLRFLLFCQTHIPK